MENTALESDTAEEFISPSFLLHFELQYPSSKKLPFFSTTTTWSLNSRPSWSLSPFHHTSRRKEKCGAGGNSCADVEASRDNGGTC